VDPKPPYKQPRYYRTCCRCGKYRYAQAAFPDAHICRECLIVALRDSGPCPSCGRDRPLIGRYVHAEPGISDGTTMAWIDWDAVITALDSGHLPSPGTEKRILRIAASLAAGHPVNLRDAIPGLDQRNVSLVVTAVRHAACQRPAACCGYRVVPGVPGRLSKHGANIGVHRSRPPWPRASGS
jgi:hypothetical protein